MRIHSHLALFFSLFSLPIWASSASASEGRAPIVFAHGVGVPAAVYEHFVPLQKVFREFGYDVYVARTPAGGSLEERAQILAREVARLVPDGPFHLVGHSMGGLDARLAIEKYGLGERCLSLTTLATPHHGSPLADWIVKAWNAGGLGSVPGLQDALQILGGDIGAAQSLTTGYVDGVFNVEVPDDARVKYFSLGFYIPSPAILYASAAPIWVMHDLLGRAGYDQNDGPVPTDSSKWGTYLGTLPGDHYSETSPIPFGGHRIDREVFGRVLLNLDRQFAH